MSAPAKIEGWPKVAGYCPACGLDTAAIAGHEPFVAAVLPGTERGETK